MPSATEHNNVFLTPRRWKMPWQTRHREVDSAQAHELLEEGKEVFHRVEPEASMVPVRSLQDLQEALDLAQGVAKDSVAEATLELERAGWSFQTGDGESLGAYSVYNSATETDFPIAEVRLIHPELEVQFDSKQISLPELQDFYYEPEQLGASAVELAGLERNGYAFFDASSSEQSGFEAWKNSNSASIGRSDENWLPLSRLGELEQFEAFLEQGLEPETCRRACELESRLDELIEQETRERAIADSLQGLGSEEADKLAGLVIDRGPATGAVATALEWSREHGNLGIALHHFCSDRAPGELVEALKAVGPEAAFEAAESLRTQNPSELWARVDELKLTESARLGAYIAVLSGSVESGVAGLSAVLRANNSWRAAKALSESALEAEAGEVSQLALAVEDLNHLGSSVLLYESALKHPQDLKAAGAEASRTVRAAGYDHSWLDARRIGKKFVAAVPGPAAQAALATDLHHNGSATRLYEAVLSAETTEDTVALGKLGREVSQELRETNYDKSWSDATEAGEAFCQQLAALGSVSAEAALTVGDINHVGSRTRVYEAVMDSPLSSPGKLGAKISETLRSTTYNKAWQDAKAAGEAFVNHLHREQPSPILEAATTVQDLRHTGSWTRVYEAVLKNAQADTAREVGEIGKELSVELRGTTYDHAWSDAAKAGKAFCQVLDRHDSATASAAARCGVLHHPGSRTRLYEAALNNAGAGAEQLGRVGAQVSRQLRGTTYDNAWRDARTAGQAFLEELNERGSGPLVSLALGLSDLHHVGSNTRLYEAVLENSEVSDPIELAELSANLIKDLAGSGYDHAGLDAARVGERLLDYLRPHLDLPDHLLSPQTAGEYQECFDYAVTRDLLEPGQDDTEVVIEEDYLVVNGVPVPIKE